MSFHPDIGGIVVQDSKGGQGQPKEEAGISKYLFRTSKMFHHD
jgi:hypothetical protein